MQVCQEDSEHPHTAPWHREPSHTSDAGIRCCRGSRVEGRSLPAAPPTKLPSRLRSCEDQSCAQSCAPTGQRALRLWAAASGRRAFSSSHRPDARARRACSPMREPRAKPGAKLKPARASGISGFRLAGCWAAALHVSPKACERRLRSSFDSANASKLLVPVWRRVQKSAFCSSSIGRSIVSLVSPLGESSDGQEDAEQPQRGHCEAQAHWGLSQDQARRAEARGGER